jgi:hypothetical protein
VEVDDLERGVVVKVGDLGDPLPVEFQRLLVIDGANPEINFGVVLLNLDSHAVQLTVDVVLGRNVGQEDVLPETIAFVARKTEHKSAAVLVMFVLPDRLHFLLEEVDVRTNGQGRWAFEVLVVGPELFDSGDVGHRMQAVLEVLALDEALEPEAEGVAQGKRLAVLLHNI